MKNIAISLQRALRVHARGGLHRPHGQRALQPVRPGLRRASLRGRPAGFTLVELALVLLVVGLLVALFLPPSLAMLEQQRRKDTREKMQALEQALARFVLVNRRLPCPANGALGTGNAQSGLEQRPAPGDACANLALQNGVVPWRSLGVDGGMATDAWGNLISYRVWARAFNGSQSSITTSLTRNAGMDMSLCDPAGSSPLGAGSSCAAGSAPLAFLAISPGAGPGDPAWRQMRGFGICTGLPCPLTLPTAPPGANEAARRSDGNGAAYVLISHGGNRYGAYNVAGTLVSSAAGPGPGPRELVNANGQAMRWTGPAPDPDPAVDNTFYVDADYDESPSNHFDDIVLRPSVLAVATAAGLGPRPR